MHMVTLFSEPSKPRRRPPSLALSVCLHGVGSSLLFFSSLRAPRIVEPALTEHYSLRLLEMHMQDPQTRHAAEHSVADSSGQEIAFEASQAAQQLQAPSIAPPDKLDMLLQPDTDLVLPQDAHIPHVLLWSAEKQPDKKIVPPPPQERAGADVPPSLQMPNQEAALAELSVAPSDSTAKMLPLAASTTSPVRVAEPLPAQRVPETASELSKEPAHTRLVSLSEPLVPAGTIAVPHVNVASSGGTARSGGQALQSGGEALSARGTERGVGGEFTTKRITLPKNGRFSMVLVGNSVEDQYPETAGMWSGRLAYTVYLHVGLAKNWILQYSLPRADQSAATGSMGRLEAPWPTDMLVPNLPAGFTHADALIVHGFLNKDGRFDALAAIFPPQSAEARSVLDVLRQWVFRPALQNGQIAMVEVLLIIPEQDD